MSVRKIISAAAMAMLLAIPTAQADLELTGVVDGDLTGGIPKAVILTATGAEDLSMWAVGSANNGNGTDGPEFILSGVASAGDTIIIASNAASLAFFQDNFVDSFILFTSGAASINGDDAIELFFDATGVFSGGETLIDLYGDQNVDGSGQSWEYADGYAVRTGGTPDGLFNQANWNSQNGALDTLDETQQAQALGAAFGFTVVPEPASAGLLGLAAIAGIGFIRRRK